MTDSKSVRRERTEVVETRDDVVVIERQVFVAPGPGRGVVIGALRGRNGSASLPARRAQVDPGVPGRGSDKPKAP